MEIYSRLGLDLEPADHAVEAGLYAVWSLLSTGRLKICSGLTNWLTEYRLYRRDEGGKVVKTSDHLPEAAFVPTCEKLAALLADAPALFDARAEVGRIVECHGDLRPEHVCLLDPPRIIDSLEFARDFRILDIADELAYLGLECERLGAPTFTQVLFDAYTHCSGDAPLARLVHFYQGLRACLRAKIALWHLDDPGPHNGLAWKAKAQGYLALAGAHTARAR